MHRILETVTTLGTAASSLGLGGLPTDAFIERFSAQLDRLMGREVARPVVDTAVGTVDSIIADTSTFVLRTDEDSVVTITVTDSTTFTLDGNDSTRDAALQVGRKATVTHEDGAASLVAVTTETEPG